MAHTWTYRHGSKSVTIHTKYKFAATKDDSTSRDGHHVRERVVFHDVVGPTSMDPIEFFEPLPRGTLLHYHSVCKFALRWGEREGRGNDTRWWPWRLEAWQSTSTCLDAEEVVMSPRCRLEGAPPPVYVKPQNPANICPNPWLFWLQIGLFTWI
jgi:hypothetical protein